MMLNRGSYVPRGARSGEIGSAVHDELHVQTVPTNKEGMQLTPMLRSLPYYPTDQPSTLTLEDSMAAQILEAMSPKSSVAVRNNSAGIGYSVTGVGRVASLSSPKAASFPALAPRDTYCSSHTAHFSVTESPKKRTFESSDDEDDLDSETNEVGAADHADMDGGMILSEEVQREILTRPPKPEGDAEWRVEWSAEQGCWSWIHHSTHGQIFSNPLEMDSDARDQAAASAPVAVFEPPQSPQNNREKGSTQRAPQVWTMEEEEQLKSLVAESGPGDWSTKSSLFNTNRSASALRHRWYSVHAGQSGSSKSLSSGIQAEYSEKDLGAHLKETRGTSAWSQEEDEALREIVERDGPRQWSTMAERLGSSRSVSALRTRWSTLRLESTRQHDETAPSSAVQRQQYNQSVQTEFAIATGASQRLGPSSIVQNPLKPRPQSSKRQRTSPLLKPATIDAAAKRKKSVGGGAWTEEEDDALRGLVDRYGVGSWALKCRQLGGRRTESALRYRWHFLTSSSRGKAGKGRDGA